MKQALEREVFLRELIEIQGLCFGWNALTGVIAEPETFFSGVANSLFGTKELTFFQWCTEHTVAAGTFYFFTKQHDHSSMNCYPHYTIAFPGNLLQFLFFRGMQRKSSAAMGIIHN